MICWRRDKSSPSGRIRSTEGRGSSDSKATADSHRAAQGSLNEMEMSRQRSRDVLLIWLVKLQERVKRVDTFVRDRTTIDTAYSLARREIISSSDRA